MALRRSRVRPPSSPPESMLFERIRAGNGNRARWNFLRWGLPGGALDYFSMEVLKQAGFMENRARTVKECQGQSVAEYAVVLALIIIIGVTVLLGVGQHSRTRLANVDTLLSEHPEAPLGSAAGAAAVTAHAGSEGGGPGAGSGSGSNQEHEASGGKH